jgi:hypothetical protein
MLGTSCSATSCRCWRWVTALGTGAAHARAGALGGSHRHGTGALPRSRRSRVRATAPPTNGAPQLLPPQRCWRASPGAGISPACPAGRMPWRRARLAVKGEIAANKNTHPTPHPRRRDEGAPLIARRGATQCAPSPHPRRPHTTPPSKTTDKLAPTSHRQANQGKPLTSDPRQPPTTEPKPHPPTTEPRQTHRQPSRDRPTGNRAKQTADKRNPTRHRTSDPRPATDNGPRQTRRHPTETNHRQPSQGRPADKRNPTRHRTSDPRQTRRLPNQSRTRRQRRQDKPADSPKTNPPTTRTQRPTNQCATSTATSPTAAGTDCTTKIRLLTVRAP